MNTFQFFLTRRPILKCKRPLSFASGACDPTAILTKLQQRRRCSKVFNALARTLVEFSAAGNTQQLAIIKEVFSKSPQEEPQLVQVSAEDTSTCEMLSFQS